MWSADISTNVADRGHLVEVVCGHLTNVADRGHLVEVEELYMDARNKPTHLVEVEELYKHAVPKQKGGWSGHVFYNS